MKHNLNAIMGTPAKRHSNSVLLAADEGPLLVVSGSSLFNALRDANEGPYGTNDQP